MKIAIVGGKLQGTEAVCLAAAAGFESILIDADPQAVASRLTNRFVCGDIVREDPQVIDALKEADLILPANENDQVLEAVERIAAREGLVLAFDAQAYQITKSKLRSDRLFHQNGIPAPAYYPAGKPPYIIKPSEESGSAGVRRAETAAEVEAFLSSRPEGENWIVQEYLTGPSYSIEVIGMPGNYRTYTITQIHMDAVYDCCVVTAPCPLSPRQEKDFAAIACRLAELVNLRGIMDVEVIADEGQLKVLEIDARLPSQTPLAVLASSGMNFLSELADIFLQGTFCSKQEDRRRWSVYEHYRRQDGQLLQEGEHMMTQAAPLRFYRDFASSQIAVCDYEDRHDFRGIFINAADTEEELQAVRSRLKEHLKLLP